MKLNQEEIKTILPHRDPMLLVTSVEELTPGEEIRASFYADPAREIFPGHFPGNPVLPGVYTVECLGQAADLVVMTTERYAGKTPLLIGVDKARFTRKVRPGSSTSGRRRPSSPAPQRRTSKVNWRSRARLRSRSDNLFRRSPQGTSSLYGKVS